VPYFQVRTLINFSGKTKIKPKKRSGKKLLEEALE
jgi:hypothetical protein